MENSTKLERDRGNVAIVGAGPYGLSLAAHLSAAGVEFQLFGKPMQTWRERMPQGMYLKSEPFASDLFDPARSFPLEQFYKENNLPYQPLGVPIPLDRFCAYGLEFQRRLVPDLDTRDVARIEKDDGGFRLTMDDGEVRLFRQVVLAVGITHFTYVPPEFSHLKPELLSHSGSTREYASLAGRRVAVIGAGSSAVDCAVALADAGAEPVLLARGDTLRFHSPPKPRRLQHKLRWPMSTVGPSWKGFLCTRFPGVFRHLPERFRVDFTRKYLGPAPCWFTREPFERQVQYHTDVRDLSLAEADGGVELQFRSGGAPSTLHVDHVIAATGYRPDLRRLTMIDRTLRESIHQVVFTPVLNSRFESSVKGLFFTGVTAANSFGPVLRFACGAGFAAERLTRELSRSRPRESGRPSQASTEYDGLSRHPVAASST